MDRFAQAGACALLVVAAALNAGCSNGVAGLTTGSVMPADAPTATTLTNTDPLARPVAVAWTTARAKRCAFYFDPAKLRANYLAYEARQGASAENYAKIERTFDFTYKSTWEKVVADPDYCTDHKGREIKADLERYLVGDYTPNLPKPKNIASCGLLGCPTTSDVPFSSSKFWRDKDSNSNR